GMECDGAPFTWAYAPLLMRAISHRQAQARRLDGSNAERAQALIDRLNPAQVCVYAMGQEPWLTYITSIEYAPDDAPIIESNRLVEHCRAQGRECDRPFGKKQIELSSKPTSPRVSSPIPVTHQPSLNIALDNTKPAPSQQINSAVPQTKRTQKHTQQTHAKANREKSSATPLTTLLTELKSLDIRLWIEGDTLRCNAPKGKLTPLLTTQIKSHKPDIIALLKGQKSSTIADSQQASEPDWKQDISLPPEIVPAEMDSATTTSNQQPATAVLLTGATGFLGTFLLYELLQQTSATVYCLVRGGAQPDAGLKKIKTCLSDYGIWQDTFTDRVIPLIGDLSQPYLGLSKTDFHQLADHIHTIYHNGAQVHHLAPYAQLRATNVLGTIEVLKLACHGMPKPLHYISTLSVFPPVPLPGKHRIDEHDDLSQYPVPAGGYNRSKWVAEQLVTQARDRNLPVSIYRPGPLSGHSETGLYNPNDFLYRLMQGYVQSGMAPQGNLPLDLLPVDYASKAIVYLSQQSSTLGKAFHLIHPHPASSDLLFEACQSAGYDIERVPYHVWHNKLQQIAHNDPTHPLYPLVALFSSRRNTSPPEATDNVQLDHFTQSSQEIPFSAANTYSHLENAPFDLPPLNQELFNTYLQKMTRKPINSE
ncbi:MAG: thioester reductase domain-containing protein, partial [Cyanobacteria bacterium J06650_10]